MKQGVIFDMDGTIWDSAKNVVSAYNEYLKSNCPDVHLVITEELLKSQMGKTGEEISRVYFKDLSVQRGLEIMSEFCTVEQNYLSRVGGTLYPQLEETLAKLKKDGYSLYIVSNCQCGYIESFYKFHKLEKYFDDKLCHGDTGKSKGETIKQLMANNHVETAVYVGDTMGDCLACQQAEIPFIYAAYGFGDVQLPVYAINKFSDLTQTVPTVFSLSENNIKITAAK